MSVQKSFWDYFWLAKLVLQAAGILPIGGKPSPWKTLITTFLAVSPGLYGLYFVIPELNFIFFRSHTVDDLLDAITVTLTVVGGQLRSVIVAINRRKIRRLFADCTTLWNDTVAADYEVIVTWAQRAKLLSTAYFCAAQFSLLGLTLAAIAKQLSSPANSTTRYYPFHFPEDDIPGLQYGIKYTLQIVIASFGMVMISSADMVGTLLALNMCGQFALIRSWLLDISKKELTTRQRNVNESSEETLKKCIRRHHFVMDFCSELEEVVCYINLPQIIAGMYLLAISGARLTKNFGSTRFFGALLLSITGLFFSCWPGDNISLASSEIADAVYGVPWYRLTPREKSAVAIMLVRSQRPVKLTAGKFVALSLETFSSIMSSSLSFCMVLYRL